MNGSDSGCVKVHRTLYRKRGKAIEHSCISCAGPAAQWAYQYNGQPELQTPSGRRYSDDARCYEPMCLSCHRKFDIRSEPDLAATHTRTALQNGAKGREVFRNDPRFEEHISAMGVLGGRARSKRMKEDPDLRARLNESSARNIRLANSVLRSCQECGKRSTPGGIGVHQYYSGHRGTS